MRNRNSIIALVVGVLAGGLAFYLLYQNASEIDQKATPVQVLVASDYIPAGVFLKPEMVEKKNVPESYVSPSAIRDLKEVEGLMSLVPISAGEQILSNKFGSGEPTLALALNPGMRAYTLEVSETSGVGSLLRPGNNVDILAKIDDEKRTVVSYVLQNVPVIAVGQKLNGKPSSQKDSGGSQDENPGYSTVTLAVKPEEAETLMYLEGHSLRLVLRGPNDEDIVSLPNLSESEVLSRLGHFTPSSHRSIQIIRGGSKQGG